MRIDPQSSLSQQKFLSTLSANMHELAQPLSIIQASLELALLSPITADQHHDVTKGALQDLQRAVECLQFMACLTRFQQPAKDVQEISLRAALESAMSDLQRTLEAAQLQILFCRSECNPSIRISPARLRRMFFYVLQAVQAYSNPGDLIHIEIQEKAGHVVLWIEQSWGQNERGKEQSEHAGSSPVHDAVVERALALAETIVGNAGGEFRVTTNPVLIVADFPAANEAGTAVDKAVDKTELSNPASMQLAVSSH